MSEQPLLRDLIVVLAASLPIALIGHRLRIPSVVGFLVAGMLIGPHGAGLVASSERVASLAEIGIVLLLFVVGLELSFRQMARLGWIIAAAGTVQLLATILTATAVSYLAGAPLAHAFFIGFLVAHSSTAIVLKVLGDRGEIDAPHGRIVAGILIIQDFSLVPMVLLTRLLAEPGAGWLSVAGALLNAAVAVIAIAVAARLAIPAALRRIVAFRSRELFSGAIVLFCLGTAWLAAQFGLSLAVGALIAGLVISESEYSHQVFADVLPFRDVLNSIFFISIGMLLYFDRLPTQLPQWMAMATAVIVTKFAIVFVTVIALYRSVRVATLSAASLAATGEMAFVLAGVGMPLGLLSAPAYQSFVGVAVMTMLAAPFLITLAPRASDWLQQRFGSRSESTPPPRRRRGHVVVIGYGLNGENLTRVLRETELPHVVLELNAQRLAHARALGEQVLFGDATRTDVLRQADIETAAVAVVAISDPAATRRIVSATRQIAIDLPLIVRTRYVAEMEQLRSLGATEVIPEEFETSVEIFARVLRRLHVPRNVINVQIELIRREGYGMLRGSSLPHQPLAHLDQILAATLTETVQVSEDSPAAGKMIRDLALRRATGVTIIAVVRNGQPFTNPGPDFELLVGDVLVLVGSHSQLDTALKVLDQQPI